MKPTRVPNRLEAAPRWLAAYCDAVHGIAVVKINLIDNLARAQLFRDGEEVGLVTIKIPVEATELLR